jgi:hypothetical protein
MNRRWPLLSSLNLSPSVFGFRVWGPQGIELTVKSMRKVEDMIHCKGVVDAAHAELHAMLV